MVTAVLVQAAMTKYRKLSGLSTSEIYVSQLWRLEDRDRGASLIEFWWEPSPILQAEDFSLDPQHGRKACSLPSHKSTNPIHKGFRLMT